MNRPTPTHKAPVAGQESPGRSPESGGMNKFPDGLRRALAALYGREPLTPEHVAEHKRLVARQMARDEAARGRQPDLLEGSK